MKNNSGQLRRQLEICNKSSRFLHVLVSLEKILVLENPGKVQENGTWLSWIFLRKVCSWKQQFVSPCIFNNQFYAFTGIGIAIIQYLCC